MLLTTAQRVSAMVKYTHSGAGVGIGTTFGAFQVALVHCSGAAAAFGSGPLRRNLGGGGAPVSPEAVRAVGRLIGGLREGRDFGLPTREALASAPRLAELLEQWLAAEEAAGRRLPCPAGLGEPLRLLLWHAPELAEVRQPRPLALPEGQPQLDRSGSHHHRESAQLAVARLVAWRPEVAELLWGSEAERWGWLPASGGELLWLLEALRLDGLGRLRLRHTPPERQPPLVQRLAALAEPLAALAAAPEELRWSSAAAFRALAEPLAADPELWGKEPLLALWLRLTVAVAAGQQPLPEPPPGTVLRPYAELPPELTAALWDSFRGQALGNALEDARTRERFCGYAPPALVGRALAERVAQELQQRRPAPELQAAVAELLEQRWDLRRYLGSKGPVAWLLAQRP